MFFGVRKRFLELSANCCNERRFSSSRGAARRSDPVKTIITTGKAKTKNIGLLRYARKDEVGVRQSSFLCKSLKKIFCDKIPNATIHQIVALGIYFFTKKLTKADGTPALPGPKAELQIGAN